jgi:hypothetical protein
MANSNLKVGSKVFIKGIGAIGFISEQLFAADGKGSCDLFNVVDLENEELLNVGNLRGFEPYEMVDVTNYTSTQVINLLPITDAQKATLLDFVGVNDTYFDFSQNQLFLIEPAGYASYYTREIEAGGLICNEEIEATILSKSLLKTYTKF